MFQKKRERQFNQTNVKVIYMRSFRTNDSCRSYMLHETIVIDRKSGE